MAARVVTVAFQGIEART